VKGGTTMSCSLLRGADLYSPNVGGVWTSPKLVYRIPYVPTARRCEQELRTLDAEPVTRKCWDAE
jgi:hypothetical protein